MKNVAKIGFPLLFGLSALNGLANLGSNEDYTGSYSYDSETEQMEIVEVPHIGSTTRESPDQNQIKLEWDGTTGAIAQFSYSIFSEAADGSNSTHTENFNVVVPGEVVFYLDKGDDIGASAYLNQRGSLSLRISNNGKLCEKHKATGDSTHSSVGCYDHTF